MKIQSIRFGMLSVPLKTPFKTAMRTVKEIEDVVVIMETDTGHTGYGSAPATTVITSETHGSIIEAINKVDLDTPSLGLYDPVNSGVQFNNAEITITDRPGLGISKIDNLLMLDI